MSNRQDDALPVAWMRVEQEGKATLDPLFLLGDPVGLPFTATYVPVYAQSAIASLQARLDAAEKDAADWRAIYERLMESQ